MHTHAGDHAMLTSLDGEASVKNTLRWTSTTRPKTMNAALLYCFGDVVASIAAARTALRFSVSFCCISP